jgi:hypothetical protein
MDELAVWYDVIRALLPQRYIVRMLQDCGVIIVGSAKADEIAYLTEESLAGRTPTDVLRSLERELRPRRAVAGHATIGNIVY